MVGGVGETGDHQHSCHDRGVDDHARWQRRDPFDERDQCGDDGHRREGSRDRVGRLRPFGDFEPGDPGDAGQPGGDPSAESGGVDDHEDQTGEPVGAHEAEHACCALRHGEGHEDARQLGGVGVDAGCCGVQDGGRGRGDGSHRQSVVAPAVVVHGRESTVERH